MGVVDCLHPDYLNDDALTHWMREQKTLLNARDVLNFNGLDNVVRQIQDMVVR